MNVDNGYNLALLACGIFGDSSNSVQCASSKCSKQCLCDSCCMILDSPVGVIGIILRVELEEWTCERYRSLMVLLFAKMCAPVGG